MDLLTFAATGYAETTLKSEEQLLRKFAGLISDTRKSETISNWQEELHLTMEY